MVFLITLVFLLVMVNGASAVTAWWKGPYSVDKHWTNPNNWWYGGGGGGVPTSADTASLNYGDGNQCEIDSSTSAECMKLWIGHYANTPSTCYLYMTGGTCTVGQEFSIGLTEEEQSQGLFSTSVFEMSGGTMTVGTKLSVSGDGAGVGHGGHATFNMTGGTVTVAGTLYISEAGGLGILNLNGGTIEADDLIMNPAEPNGLIDIGAGTLILNGDKTAKVNGYINEPNNWIIAYGGDPRYAVRAEYNSGTGKTTVQTTNPENAGAPFPKDKATRVPYDVVLSWSPGLYAADVNGHDVYLGINESDVTNAASTTPLGVYMGRQDANSYDTNNYDANGLKQGLIYYWRIDEVNTAGPDPNIWTGDVWEFTFVDGRAWNPSPAPLSPNVPPNVVLSWSPGLYAADVNGHNVYFGTSETDVNDANTSSSRYRGNQDSNTYDAGSLESLQLGQTYYWRIDEVNTAGPDPNIWTGEVWSFTVLTGEEYSVIDDFESYADGNGLRLNWIDGSDGNNSTGSLVFLETDMPHNDAKSMKYKYDNGASPYYCEVCRIYNTPQDWTLQGTKVLSLFFHGVEDNDAEQMYVILQDDGDVNAAVLYEGDADDLIQQEAEYWNVWNIMLRDFSDKGVDLTGIKKIVIGFGDRNNPQPGGSGTVYFDDIKLYTSRCAADYDYLPGSDFNRDAMVNVYDYAELAYAWMTNLNESGFDRLYDLDGNDVINADDLSIFTQNWLWPDKQVRITVDACDIKGDISTMLTGVNMNFADDTDAMWADGSVAGYLSDVKAGILRYPGGAKTGHYHWEYPEVPKYVDAWDPAVDPNDYTSTAHMDTDEYIAWCGVIGAEPLLGINIQSGIKWGRINDSIAEARRWVQYCKDNNYNVTYWYLDNELYYGHNADPITVEEYTNYIKQFVPAMRAVDPNIKIVVGWENKLSVQSYWDDWEYLIEEAHEYIDIADVHWYWAWGYCNWDLWLADTPMIVREWCGDCTDSKYYGPTYAEEIRQFYEKIKDVNGVSYDIKLAALEWNVAPNHSFDFSRFQHALIQAEMLGQYIEGGLHMACMWPLTWIGDIGNNFRSIIDQENHKPTPSFHVFKLYSNALGQQLIASQSNQPYIPHVSALSQDGNTLWVYLLNKSGDGQPVRAMVDISGFTAANAEAIALTAPDLSYDIGRLKKLRVNINSQTGIWQSVLPPYSLTMLTFHK